MRVNEPFDLVGARNVRELGGYQTSDGHHTRKGVFLRADGTHALTDGDIAKLKDAGVSLVIDMRSPDEVERMPSRFSKIQNIQYENVVMFDGLQSSMFRDAMPKSMAELYCRLLDTCQQQYNTIFSMFIANRGTSLFHCTAGKDRTGVVAMLLLELANVPESLIVADYAVSEKNMMGMFFAQHKQLEAEGIVLPEFIFGSREEDMEETLHHLKVKYHGAASYLKQCGLSQEDVSLLRNKFVV